MLMVEDSGSESGQRLVGAVVALSLVLAIAAPAARGSGLIWGGSQVCPGPDPEGCISEFTIPATDGYTVTVSGQVDGTGYNVLLAVHGHKAAALYMTRGKVTPSSIEASFGRLGIVSLRFRPSGRTRRVRVPRRCLGEEPPLVKARHGTFTGTIRFSGEGDYMEAFAHRLKGGVGDPIAIDQPLDCERGPTGSGRRKAHAVQLEAAGSSKGNVDFQAWAGLGWVFKSTTGRPSSLRAPDTFTASVNERREGMLISRIVVAPGPDPAFAFETSLDSATIIPPAPFSGSASFSRTDNGQTAWTGDLAVPLPGLGVVPLAGSSFVSRLADNRVFP